MVVTISATTIHIPQDYPTIQAGIDAASDGDTVFVASGTYVENIIWPATNGIKLIGSGEYDCIIDGNQSGSVIRFENDLDGIIDTTTLITGFTIQNGWAEDSGGGIIMSGSSPTFRDVTISGNSVGYCTIIDGCEGFGGGIYLYNSNPVLRDMTINDNSSDSTGGGMYLLNSSPILTNVTVSGNTAKAYGGGMLNIYGSNPTLTNSIFWGNSPYEIYLWGDAISITYSDIQGGWEGEGNIDADPLFCNPDSSDFRLLPDSPCIGTGQNGDNMGSLEVGCEPLAISEVIVFPTSFTLHQNFPNPFNPITTLSYDLPSDALVTLSIYDMLGREITQLMNTTQQAGFKSVQWDATDSMGRPVSAGVYLYQIQAGDPSFNSGQGFVQTKKMVLLK
jgi:hypothetical protein